MTKIRLELDLEIRVIMVMVVANTCSAYLLCARLSSCTQCCYSCSNNR